MTLPVMAICYQAICLTHGPMRHYQDREEWVCLGFDGEGHSGDYAPVPDAAVSRIGDGETRWPGVRVEVSVQ